MTRQMLRLPEPQIHRRRAFTGRKLGRLEKTQVRPFFMVPRFFDMYHPTTTWLINTVVSENEKELDRVLIDKETNGLLKFEPDKMAIQDQQAVTRGCMEFVITKGKYFQILDRPELYEPECGVSPLFGRHSVLYLTPLGLAIYLRKPKAAKQLLECINRDTNKKHVLARQPQFVTCFSDRFGDLMCLYDHNLAMLNESYEILYMMICNVNWFPTEPFKLMYRKRFIETSMIFDDFMDYAFYLIFTKCSSLNICRLCEVILKRPTKHFKLSHMCQPSRAMQKTLVRDAEKVINNCKTYPRRLLRCAFYADKKLKSTVNLIRAANVFAQTGMFRLPGEPSLPFNPKEGRRKRLEALPPYKQRSRDIQVEWPSALYEFDCDCCIALLCGLLSKCHRLDKKVPFQMALTLATKCLADAGWLDWFSRVSDLELRDYFIGLDDAEKLRFRPEIFSYIRECVKISLYEGRYKLNEFFTDTRIRAGIKNPADIMNNDVLREMVQCNDANVVHYVNIQTGEKLRPEGTVIGGPRVRGEGRDNPKNTYYMDRNEFPPESMKTVMTNTANYEMLKKKTTDDQAKSSSHSSAEAALVNCSNCSRMGDDTPDNSSNSTAWKEPYFPKCGEEQEEEDLDEIDNEINEAEWGMQISNNTAAYKTVTGIEPAEVPPRKQVQQPQQRNNPLIGGTRKPVSGMLPRRSLLPHPLAASSGGVAAKKRRFLQRALRKK